MADLNCLWGIYYDMIKRCYDKNYFLYKSYGEIGVTVCPEWLNNRSSFNEWANLNNYKKGMRLKLCEKEVGYFPSNCYFSNKRERKLKENKQKEGSKTYRSDKFKSLLGVEKYIDSPIYISYYAMIDRCCNPKNKSYKWYGAKGIKVCDEWAEDIIGFERFSVWSLENGWRKGLTIDRINADKDYCPENCRWITIQEQQINKSNSLNFMYSGQIRNLSEIAKENNLCYSNLYRKIMYDNYSVEDAINYLKRRRKGKKNSMYHSKQVAQIDSNGEIAKVFPSAKSAADSYGKLSGSLTKACRNGTTWLGKRWKYITEDEYNEFLKK